MTTQKSSEEKASHLDTPWLGARTWYLSILRNIVDGPWRAEFTEKIHWIDPATGLHCLIVRNLVDERCAYVAVRPDHPMHGLQDKSKVNLSVPGGSVLSGTCNEEIIKEISTCHSADDLGSFWWFGFDCCRVGLQLEFDAEIRPIDYRTGISRDIPFVKSYVENLAQQLHKRGK